MFNGLIIVFLLSVYGCFRPKDEISSLDSIELGMELQRVVKILKEEDVEIEIMRTESGYLGYTNFDPSPTAFNVSNLIFDQNNKLIQSNLVVNGKHIKKGSIKIVPSTRQ